MDTATFTPETTDIVAQALATTVAEVVREEPVAPSLTITVPTTARK